MIIISIVFCVAEIKTRAIILMLYSSFFDVKRSFTLVILFFVLLLIVAITLIYCTSKHQRLLSQRLPKKARVVGYVLMTISFTCAFQLFVGAAVLFSWLVAVMALTALIPLTILMLFRKS